MTAELREGFDADVSAVDEQPAVQTSQTTEEARSGWLQNLFHRILGSKRFDRRLRELDHVIALRPDVVVNYVLRGELHLKQNKYELAASDFERACKLAAEQMQTNNWGIVAQAMYDRAQVGLKQVERRAPHLPQHQPDRLLDEDVAENAYDHSTEHED